jgi:hypothetical protein
MSGHSRTRPLALLLTLLPGCFSDSQPDAGASASGPGVSSASTAPPTTGEPAPTTSGASEDGTSASEPDPGSTTSGDPRLDLGAGPDFGPRTTGCDKVDLLFVIDNSLSMAAEQTSLISSFPGFITGIQDQLVDADSYHVGVVTTDAFAHNAADCRTLGALVTSTDDGPCGPYAAGGGYMSEADDLAATFDCAARVGLDGDHDEQPVAAADAAIGAALAGPGGCNAGFIRDDALLVVTLISDEEDDVEAKNGGSPGDPDTWFTNLVGHKAGIETNVVLLTIIGGAPGNSCPPYSPPTGAEDAPRLRALADLFTYGSVGDVCAASYDVFFQSAIAAIDTACQKFTPPF